MTTVTPYSEGLLAAARWEALRWYLDGNEEGALDLLRACTEMTKGEGA